MNNVAGGGWIRSPSIRLGCSYNLVFLCPMPAVAARRVDPGALSAAMVGEETVSQKDRILEALKKVNFPGLDHDIVSLGYVKEIQESDGRSIVLMQMSTSLPEAATEIEKSTRAALDQLGIAYDLVVDRPAIDQQHTEPAQQPKLLADVPVKIAVASGKGGVGKSTVAVNLALALARLDKKVGLLDCDIYGPSIPLMMGMEDAKPEIEGQKVKPIGRYDINTMSLGYLIDRTTPVIWRGPMAAKALDQLMSDIDWSGTEVLVLDLPPGTGDIQITLAQRTSLSGAVIVTTPQDVALVDASKGVTMFQKVNIPVIGMIENMSAFVCPHCGESTEVFGPSGTGSEAARLGVPMLGSIPIDPRVATGGDAGKPIIAEMPDSPAAKAFENVAKAIHERLK